MAATAPAKGLAGIADFGAAGWQKLLSLMGSEGAPSDNMTPAVDRLTDALAGRPVPQSVGRSAFEGAITAPLSGAKGAQLPAAVTSGATAGGVSELAKEKGLNEYAQLGLGMASGYGAGGFAANAKLTPAEFLAKNRLRQAMEGLRPEDFPAGKKAMGDAAGEGIKLTPSQALQVPAEGLQSLEAALLKSRASGADAMRTSKASQATRVQDLVEGLRSKSGQQPRMDDDLANDVFVASKGILRKQSEAVNDATRPLYNDPLAKNWKIKPEVAQNVNQGFAALFQKHRADGPVLAVLQEAQQELSRVLANPNVTPEELTTAIRTVKSELPSYEAAGTSASNRAQGIVKEAIKPLEALVAKHAPTIPQAQQMQADLRGTLANSFSEVTRQAKAKSGTSEAVLTALEKRPEVIAEVAKKNPQLAQEALQRQLNKAVEGAFQKDSRTGLPPGNEGIVLQKTLTEGPGGKAFQKNLPLLFHGAGDPQAAAEGFRRVLAVVANASKPVEGSGAGRVPGLAEEAVRGSAGTTGQKVGVAARLANTLTFGIRDNAAISILQRPDVMQRLEILAKMPTPKLTTPAVLAVVPQLFEEPQQ